VEENKAELRARPEGMSEAEMIQQIYERDFQ